MKPDKPHSMSKAYFQLSMTIKWKLEEIHFLFSLIFEIIISSKLTVLLQGKKSLLVFLHILKVLVMNAREAKFFVIDQFR